MNPLAACTAAVSPNAFQWVGQPTKLPVPVVDRDAILHGSLGPRESAPLPEWNFSRSSCFCSTYRQAHGPHCMPHL